MPDREIYTQREEHQGITVKISLYYRVERRRNSGFYLSAVPVEFNGEFESFVLTDVRTEMVHPCQRYSPKQEAEARTKASQQQPQLVDQIVAAKLGQPRSANT